jgi:hypothetical protein
MNPQTLNRYSYCLNNPLRYIDPSGNESLDDYLNILDIYGAEIPKDGITLTVGFNDFTNGVEFVLPDTLEIFPKGTRIGTLSSGNILIGVGENKLTINRQVLDDLQNNGWTYEQIANAVFHNPIFETDLPTDIVVTGCSKNISSVPTLGVSSSFGVSTLLAGGAFGIIGKESPRFSANQQAIIDLAKEAMNRRGGLTTDEAKILQGWADEYGLSNRGPEISFGRLGMSGWRRHYHFGTKEHFWELP